MNIIDTELSDIKILIPEVYNDTRGLFFESYNSSEFNKLIGGSHSFVQDNHSSSNANVLRGLHYQLNNPQGKLIRVLNGKIYDVAVDIRKKSNTFGKWIGKYLSSENNHQLWIPVGFAHGFYVISENADVSYKTTDFYTPEDERCILWNDSFLSIDWPLLKNTAPLISSRDVKGVPFRNADYFK